MPSLHHLSPRRYGSIGTGAGVGAHSPSASRTGFPPPPPPPPAPSAAPHPLATMTSPPPPGQGRRHTSADIRVHGWEAHNHHPHQQHSHHPGTSPFASGQSSSAWPSSPRAPPHPGDQQIRDALAQYELARVAGTGGSRAQSPGPHDPIAAAAAPPVFGNSFGANAAPAGSSLSAAAAAAGPGAGAAAVPSYANPNDAGWQLPGARYPFKGLETPPGPPTRRSSMASNVHSLLNPADTAEREGEEEGGGSGAGEERKRKRVG